MSALRRRINKEPRHIAELSGRVNHQRIPWLAALTIAFLSFTAQELDFCREKKTSSPEEEAHLSAAAAGDITVRSLALFQQRNLYLQSVATMGFFAPVVRLPHDASIMRKTASTYSRRRCTLSCTHCVEYCSQQNSPVTERKNSVSILLNNFNMPHVKKTNLDGEGGSVYNFGIVARCTTNSSIRWFDLNSRCAR